MSGDDVRAREAEAEPASALAPDTTVEATPDQDPTFAPGYKPLRSATLTFTQAILGLQALAALFATTFVAGMANAGAVEASSGVIWGLGLWLMVMLGYAAGQQKKPWGKWLGWALQVPLLLGFFIDPAIAIVGVMFLALWIAALRIGGRIDRERAERDDAAAAAREGADTPSSNLGATNNSVANNGAADSSTASTTAASSTAPTTAANNSALSEGASE